MSPDPDTPRGTAAEVVFDHVTKVYPGRQQPAVDDLSLTIPPGEICVLIGPSGGGKTTALKMVNRLITITEGDILIDGRGVRGLDLAELRRGIGYVIQQVGLFPHMTVADNIATVPRLLGWDKARIANRVGELLELVGLDPTADRKRYPAQLSGGQRQRVGLARALAADPPLMLMDEPFGAIDPITRERLQDEFLRLQREIGKTVIFVTHDIDEAVKMGDRVAILREGGKLAQYDTPDAILARPADDFVARFVGADRGLKRLTLSRIGDLELPPAPAAHDDELTARLTTSLRDALSIMLADGRSQLVAVDDDGNAVGLVTLDRIRAAVSPEAAAEEEGART
ncbi:MAG: transporter related [Solirubrobacterales bacterium]|nr:transporter related [Solirubrobacterales bacterium]